MRQEVRDLSRRRKLPENIYNTRIISQCVGFAVGDDEGEGLGRFVVGLLDGASVGAERRKDEQTMRHG